MLIECRNLVKSYQVDGQNFRAVDEVSFSVAEGEFLAILGHSGSGKTTLLNQIGCLDQPTSGDLYIEGKNTRELSDFELTNLRRDAIGFIFQKFNLIPLLTAFENVEYPLILKTGSRDITGKPAELLRLVGLDGSLAQHTPNQLSGGQQQRVAIARALANDPRILLCDEPTGNLDSKTGTQIMELLHDLNREGKTIVMVTHSDEIATYADRIITIRDGVIQ